MPTYEREVRIVNKYGLHARPAMQFVELANRYNCRIEVSNGVLTVDAKSIMSVMRLAATRGTVLRIVTDGADAAQATEAMTDLVASEFGRPEAGPCSPLAPAGGEGNGKGRADEDRNAEG